MEQLGKIKNILPETKRVCSECGKPYKKKELNGFLSVYVPDCTCGDKLAKREEDRQKRIRIYKLLKQRLKDASFPYDTKGKRLKTRTCENIEAAKEYIKNFKPRSRQGLYFVGKVGNAKTTLLR